MSRIKDLLPEDYEGEAHPEPDFTAIDARENLLQAIKEQSIEDDIEQARREWELSQFTDEEIASEYNKRDFDRPNYFSTEQAPEGEE